MQDPVDSTTELLAQLRQELGDRYGIERLLGRGGMAAVWLARDRKHANRAVAIKTLRPEIASLIGPDRFLREIEIAARLNHPHIVPVFDSGESGGRLYYVMPFVEGETLRERLTRQPPISPAEAVRIVSHVASALEYAHAHGVVHRDVKPENIMLAGDQAVVTDFGIAHALQAEDGLTAAGRPLGTPGYMSPEQATAAVGVDARSDVYSLGCVLHELLVGHPVHGLLSPESVRRGRVLDCGEDVRRRLDALPAGLEAVLVRALAPLPEERFPSAAELLAALQQGLAAAPLPPASSVAVLPFETLAAAAEEQYLGEGLAEEITMALSRVRTLRVASRTSAFAAYKREPDVRAIGRDLGVATVLEGSVRRSGDRLRITVRLVDTGDGYEVWSERFDRPMKDVFAIQDEIARSVVAALEVILTESERRALSRTATSDVTAYEFYLRGRQYLHQIRRRSLEYARQMFSRAIEIDPTYALAYAGLADAASLLRAYYRSAVAPAVADEASRRALELDPDLPEAHSARGFALFHLEQYDEAAKEFETAIRLDPAQFEARYFYARQCFQRGNPAEAARWFEDAARVREDYPARFFAAQSYEALGQHEQAKEGYRRALEVAGQHLELNPDDPRAATMCAVALCRLGEHERGLEFARRALEVDPEDAGVRYNVACLYALEGLPELALDTLEECIKLGFGNPEWLSRDPDLASLRDLPRFQALLATT